MVPLWIRPLFLAAGLYDFVLGLAFVFPPVASWIFAWAGAPAPNHWGYIQFAALMLLVFGVMFFAVAGDPRGNRNLIPFGMLLKLCYVFIVAHYWSTDGVPTLFQPFAVLDALFLILFLIAYRALRPAAATA